MIKALITSQNTVRVETETDADDFHKQVQKECEQNGYTLTSFTKSLKEKKSKGEVIDSWYIVKYTLTFTDAKEPERFLDSIEYNMRESSTEGELPW